MSMSACVEISESISAIKGDVFWFLPKAVLSLFLSTRTVETILSDILLITLVSNTSASIIFTYLGFSGCLVVVSSAVIPFAVETSSVNACSVTLPDFKAPLILLASCEFK